MNKGPYHYALGNTKEHHREQKKTTRNKKNYGTVFFETRGTNLLKQKGINHYSLGDEK
jgi:hypothetical protein